jgi:hypothetical protein
VAGAVPPAKYAAVSAVIRQRRRFRRCRHKSVHVS